MVPFGFAKWNLKGIGSCVACYPLAYLLWHLPSLLSSPTRKHGTGLRGILLSFSKVPVRGFMQGGTGVDRRRDWGWGIGGLGCLHLLSCIFKSLMYSMERALGLSWENYYSLETLQCGQIALAFSSSRSPVSLTSSTTPPQLASAPHGFAP